MIKQSIKKHLEMAAQWGVDYLPSSTSPNPSLLRSIPVGLRSIPVGLRSIPVGLRSIPVGQRRGDHADRNSNAQSLQSLRDEIGDCQRCPLYQQRTNLVFGVGNPNAQLMFVGEGPGRDEDLKGEPFVGLAGQLLTKMIQAMGLQRPDVYIANVVKCHPPQNRNPEPGEIATCQPYLQRQIEIIQPQVIVCLGKFAAHTLLKTEISITKLRGEFHEYGSMKLMPTYHPAFLLRNPNMKRVVWQDLKKVMKILGLE